MKSDPAISPSGMPRPSLPPSPPKRLVAPVPPAPPRIVPPSASARPSRYLPPAPTAARPRAWTNSFSFLGDANLLLLAVVVLVLTAMAFLFLDGEQHVTIRVNDQEMDLWTRQTTVRNALTEAGLTWNAQDLIRPGLDEPLPSNGLISIRPATPILLTA